MSFLGLFESPPKQKSRTCQGTQFEIFVEKLFRHYYSGIQRNTVFEVRRGKQKIHTSQIDICCNLGHFYSLKDKYGLFELKYSNEFTINEDAVGQLLRSCYNLARRQSRIEVEPVAVVTNRDFTSGARGLAAKYNVRLINGKELQIMRDEKSWFSKQTIDEEIRAVNVRRYRTAPNYVHVHT